MINFLIDNIFVECGGEVFQQVIGIPMGTNCAPLLADIFLYSYEAEFIQTLIRSGKRHSAKSFNFTYRYIDDVFSLNNHKFSDYVYDIYPVELEIKETTDDQYHSSFLDLLLEIDKDSRLRVKIYDKRDDFNFDIVNFPFLCGNIPQSPSYGVYISQLIRYACASTIIRKSRVSYPGPGFRSSATWPSLPKKHYNGLNQTNLLYMMTSYREVVV